MNQVILYVFAGLGVFWSVVYVLAQCILRRAKNGQWHDAKFCVECQEPICNWDCNHRNGACPHCGHRAIEVFGFAGKECDTLPGSRRWIAAEHKWEVRISDNRGALQKFSDERRKEIYKRAGCTAAERN